MGYEQENEYDNEDRLMRQIKKTLRQIFKSCYMLVYKFLAGGFIIYKFIPWFLNPVLNQPLTISYAQSIGLIFIFSLFKTISTSKYYLDGVELKKIETVKMDLIAPVAILGTGWLAHIIITSVQ